MPLVFACDDQIVFVFKRESLTCEKVLNFESVSSRLPSFKDFRLLWSISMKGFFREIVTTFSEKTSIFQ